MGEDKIDAKVQIADLPAPFMISGIDENNKIAIGDEVKLECGAIVYNHTNQLQWLKDGIPIEIRSDLHIKDSHTRFSYRKTLHFDAIKEEDRGEYSCETYDSQNELRIVPAILTLHNAEPPLIVTNFNQSSLSKALGEALTLECYVTGLPIPQLTW